MLEPDRIVRLEPDAVVVLDQRRLPAEQVELVCRSVEELAAAIVTERGVHRSPYVESLAGLVAA